MLTVFEITALSLGVLNTGISHTYIQRGKEEQKQEWQYH